MKTQMDVDEFSRSPGNSQTEDDTSSSTQVLTTRDCHNSPERCPSVEDLVVSGSKKATDGEKRTPSHRVRKTPVYLKDYVVGK